MLRKAHPQQKELVMSNSYPIILSDDGQDFSKCFHWLMRRNEISDRDKIVYTRLRNISPKAGVYEVSQAYLAHECGCSVDSIKRAVKRLVEVGLISKIRNGKKMYNHYHCHIHPWMEEDRKFNKSEVAESPITESEVANPHLVKCDPATSIYKEQNKKQNNICNFAKKSKTTKLNDQIKEIYLHWKKEIKQPNWSLTDDRYSAIKRALVTGVKIYDEITMQKFEDPLTVEQIKELISLHAKDPWWIEVNKLDLPSMLTKRRLTEYVTGQMKKDNQGDDISKKLLRNLI